MLFSGVAIDSRFVLRTILEHGGVFHRSILRSFVGLFFVEEGVCTVGVDVAVALVALGFLLAGACVNEGQEEEDRSRDH